MNNILMLLHQFLLTCRVDMERAEAAELLRKSTSSLLGVSMKERDNKEGTESLPSESERNQLLTKQPVDSSKYVALIQNLADTQLIAQRHFESALERNQVLYQLVDGVAANCSGPMDHDETTGFASAGEDQPSRKLVKLNNGMAAPKREPWYPILSNMVCFDMTHHPGTAKWRDAVKAISDNTIRFPEWSDEDVDAVKGKLAYSNDCTTFLVFLDSQYKPTESIQDGLWYRATEGDILAKTKQQFLVHRRTMGRT